MNLDLSPEWVIFQWLNLILIAVFALFKTLFKSFNKQFPIRIFIWDLDLVKKMRIVLLIAIEIAGLLFSKNINTFWYFDSTLLSLESGFFSTSIFYAWKTQYLGCVWVGGVPEDMIDWTWRVPRQRPKTTGEMFISVKAV